MKKILALLACALLIFVCAACVAPAETRVEELSGLQVYTQFLDKMESGKLYKLHYSFHTWLDFISSESTTIRFAQKENGKRELTYRERNPFVLWDVPPYDYCDGENYYYKYKSTWFADTFSKFQRVQKTDFFEIQKNFFSGNNVVTDEVFKHGSGHRIASLICSPDKTVYFSLMANTNADFIFSTIRIKEYHFDSEAEKYEHVGTYLFRYSDVNKGKPVPRPKDLALP